MLGVHPAGKLQDTIHEPDGVIIAVQQPFVLPSQSLMGQQGGQRCPCVPWILCAAIMSVWVGDVDLVVELCDPQVCFCQVLVAGNKCCQALQDVQGFSIIGA